ncbi:hypothetical protein HDF13_003790 [Edaphobacter lichenicola]|uniref:Uncharacterized protein n=1 Tax=Tunturiibacter gelidiferens TaxID=3069689 RepID=A0ACC5P3M9_9BACT|nr:hypothetical protein [Edaphobacter lichenicola]
MILPVRRRRLVQWQRGHLLGSRSTAGVADPERKRKGIYQYGTRSCSWYDLHEGQYADAGLLTLGESAGVISSMEPEPGSWYVIHDGHILDASGWPLSITTPAGLSTPVDVVPALKKNFAPSVGKLKAISDEGDDCALTGKLRKNSTDIGAMQQAKRARCSELRIKGPPNHCGCCQYPMGIRTNWSSALSLGCLSVLRQKLLRSKKTQIRRFITKAKTCCPIDFVQIAKGPL